MTDWVIDTNVLLVASAADPGSPFGDTHVPPAQQKEVFEWLVAFRSGESALVLDDQFKIYMEYRKKLTDQDYGLLVVNEKMQSFRPVALDWDEQGAARVPEPCQHFDPSDRKFLAAALTDPDTISIANATDSDWLELEAELGAVGVRVVHVIEEWLRASRT